MGIGWRVPRRGERCVADRRQRRHNGARSHAITVWDERKKNIEEEEEEVRKPVVRRSTGGDI